MARNEVKVELETGVYNLVELDDLIPQYGEHKSSLDEMDKTCKKENARIKEIMKFYNKDTAEANGWKITYSTSTRSDMDEDKLLDILRKDWTSHNGSMQCPYIKTKEYVDMDALENAIYNGDLSKEVLLEIKTCEKSKTVETLRIARTKKED